MKVTETENYKRLNKFRDPYTLDDRDDEDYIMSVTAAAAWEDLELDINRINKNPEKIFERLDVGVFSFLEGQNDMYQKDGYDYLFRFSDYEYIEMHINRAVFDIEENIDDENMYNREYLNESYYFYHDGYGGSDSNEKVSLGYNDHLSRLWFISMHWLEKYKGNIDIYSDFIDTLE